MRIEIYLSYEDIQKGTALVSKVPNKRLKVWWADLVDYHWRCANAQKYRHYPEKEDLRFFWPPPKRLSLVRKARIWAYWHIINKFSNKEF